jgi:subtilisin-like proprotein convertase family protein
MRLKFTLKLSGLQLPKAFLMAGLFLCFSFFVNAQTTITTTFTNNNNFSLVTMNFTNNNTGPVMITDIASVCSASGAATATVFYKTSAITAAPGAINAGNGWVQFGTGNFTAVATTGTTPQPFLSGLTLQIPAGATYGLAVQSAIGGTGNLAYSTVTAGTYTNTGGNCVITSGSNVSFAGDVAPNAPTFTPRAFIGSITFSNVATTPCAGTPAPGNTVSTVSTVCGGTSFTLSLQNPTPGSGVSYQWQSSATAAGPYTNIAGATSTTLTTTQSAATYYHCVVTCSTNPPGTSSNLLVALTPASGCYCTPASTTCTLDDQITNVTFGGINNSSTCSTNGYGNYTSLTPGVAVTGAPNPISVSVGPGGTEYVGVWIDYNQNGTFETTEFTLIGSGNGTTITGSIVVPATALTGTTRMRLRVQYNTAVTGADACTQPSIYGEVEDYNVTLSACTPVTISTNPTDKTVVCGSTTTFATTTTGTFPSYLWEYRTTATGVWLVVPNAAPYSGVSTGTLTVTGASTTMSGYQYRALVSGACAGPTPTTAATLTVTPMVAVVTPTSANICLNSGTIIPIVIGNAGGTATSTFTTTTPVAIQDATGVAALSPITVSGIPAGAVITKIAVTIISLTHTYVGDLDINLKAPGTTSILNLVGGLDGGTGSNGTANFTGTTIASDGTVAISGFAAPRTGSNFKPDGLIGYGPTGQEATISTFAPYLALPTLNGVWSLAAGDFAGGDVGTINSWSIAITYGAAASGTFTAAPVTPNSMFTDAAATIPYTGTALNTIYVKPNISTTYTVNVNTGTCQATTTVPVTVNAPVAGTPTVASQTTCATINATFSVAGITGGTGLTYQWQVSTPTAPTFVNIAGATSATYTVSGPASAQNGNQYRVVVSSAGCTATTLTSTAGTLTVNPAPVVVISASPSTTVIPGSTVTLTAAVSPNGAASYQWYNNGVAVAGATNNTLVVGIDGIGSYTVKVTDANGCTNGAQASTPGSIVVTTTATTQLFIYPSPNTGKFQVRYFNDLNDGPNGPAILNVYDSKGTRVFTRRYVLGPGYQSMGVDLASHGKGVYRIDLLNTNGERIKTGNVMVY